MPMKTVSPAHVLIVVLMVGAVGTAANRRQQSSGEAGIGGVVLGRGDAGAEAPIRDALVVLSASGLPEARSQRTDSSGRFLFQDLPDDRYTVQVSKNGYLATEYGALRGGEPGTPVVVTHGRANRLTVRLSRGSVLSGRILTADAAAAAGVEVSAKRPDGSVVATVVAGNDGTFRLFGVPPGSYVLAAAPAAGRSSAWPVTYFPGGIEPDDRSQIPIGAEEERVGLDFSLLPPATERVEGRVTDLDGKPIQTATISVSTPFDTLRQTTSNRDGMFAIAGVSPGRFSITARYTERAKAMRSSPQALLDLLDGGPSHWAEATIHVVPGTVTNVALTARPTRSVAGSVQRAGVRAASAEAAAVTVTLTPLDRASRQQPISARSTSGAFALAGLRPGRHRVTARIDGAPEWWLKSVSVSGEPLVHAAIDVQDADVRDVVLTLSADRSTLSGNLLDADNHPATAFWIVAFPVEPDARYPESPRVVRTRPATDGRFAFDQIPVGEYLVGVFDDVADEAWNGAEFLSRLADSALRVTVRADGPATLQLRVRR
jgi:hypothetical protein